MMEILGEGTDIQAQEAQRVPNKMNPKRATPRHIMIKMPKVKDRENLKSSRRKAVSYLQGSSHKTISDEKQGRTTKIILPSKVVI